MKIYVEGSVADYGKRAGELVAAQVSAKPRAVLGLPTGSTPIPMYQELIALYKAGKVDFSQVTTFNLDEYVGLAATHDQSYYYFMQQNLFHGINVKPENIHLPHGVAANLQQETQGYEKAIKAAGGLDLQVLGIGHNGHIGFNEPGSAFESVTRAVDVTMQTRLANARFFSSVDEVPKKAISMGIKTIMTARSLLLLVMGADKAEILLKALTGSVTPEVPASILQLHPCLTIITDAEAGRRIKDLA